MYAALRWRCDVMQILVATLRGAVHQQQRAAAYAALLSSLMQSTFLGFAALSYHNRYGLDRGASRKFEKGGKFFKKQPVPNCS